ncbi:hypothetical protein Q3G72_003578 [Acer saccharum]|nr:hypothetical protein Q3G72_003578 [Acer saccharum]
MRSIHPLDISQLSKMTGIEYMLSEVMEPHLFVIPRIGRALYHIQKAFTTAASKLEKIGYVTTSSSTSTISRRLYSSNNNRRG